MNNWIVPYSWSLLGRDGFLQPYLIITPQGKAHLVRCALLNQNLQQVGSWERNVMPLSVVRDIEARYVKECVKIDLAASPTLVPINPLKLER